MALHHQLPIHRTGTELLGLAARIHAQMPRGYKRSVGDKIVGHCSEMLDLMALANASRGAQRVQFLEQILHHNRAATVWLRVGFDLRAPNPVIPQALLEAIVAAGPGGISREDVAAATGMTASGGTFTTYLGDLRRNGLITERDKRCTANDILFPKGGR